MNQLQRHARVPASGVRRITSSVIKTCSRRHASTTTPESTSNSTIDSSDQLSKRTQRSTLRSTMQLFKEPEEVSDFGAYSRIENKQPIKEEVARRSPALLALHARLGLDKDKFAYSTLAQALICRSATTGFADNLGMASFGKNLLSFYVYEYFMVKYPRLPPSILRHVVSLYTSEAELYRMGSNMGVEADTRPPLARYLAEETDEDLIGKLIFQADTVKREDGVVELLQSEEEFRINHTKAMASFVRALVAGVYAHHGLEQAREYIHNYIIKPHKIDMASLIAFEQPTRELAVLCAREGLKNPVSRLMMETGRFSKSPVFVVGVFSGKSKLGEGQGSSLTEARTRAAVHALKSWYLYSPVNVRLPSDPAFSEDKDSKSFIDSGVVVM